MGSYGPKSLSLKTSNGLRLSCDGAPEWRSTGITIDWSLVAAVSGSPVTLKDGLVIPIGEKYLRYGQVLARVTVGGKWGPYDPAAADGREALVRGACAILDQTVLEKGMIAGLSNSPASDHPGVIEGGYVWFDRVIQSGVAAHTLALGPTKVEFLAAFPRILIKETE